MDRGGRLKLLGLRRPRLAPLARVAAAANVRLDRIRSDGRRCRRALGKTAVLVKHAPDGLAAHGSVPAIFVAVQPVYKPLLVRESFREEGAKVSAQGIDGLLCHAMPDYKCEAHFRHRLVPRCRARGASSVVVRLRRNERRHVDDRDDGSEVRLRTGFGRASKVEGGEEKRELHPRRAPLLRPSDVRCSVVLEYAPFSGGLPPRPLGRCGFWSYA